MTRCSGPILRRFAIFSQRSAPKGCGSLARAMRTCLIPVHMMRVITTQGTSLAMVRSAWRMESPRSRAQDSSAEALETAAIQHLQCVLRVGVNDKSADAVPHDEISAARPQALYIVPVLPRFTTQQQFWDEHKSYYKQDARRRWHHGAATCSWTQGA